MIFNKLTIKSIFVQIGKNAYLSWSKRVPSDSSIRDALGIWGHHLKIQSEFTRGITSVTFRVRYYTLLAWYWEHLYGHNGETINLTDYEKLFILACLAHHDGDGTAPGLLHIYDKQRLSKKWDQQDIFDLREFKIGGFGSSYYNKQLAVLKCAWTDYFGNFKKTTINSKLAGSLGSFELDFFKKKVFTKEELKTLENFCACTTLANAKEKDLISKLFFGFICKKGDDWDIDEDEYRSFMNGHVELDFNGTPFSENVDFENPEFVREICLRRRNTLFLFLKIIEETTPPKNDFQFRRFIWDAVYFKQNRHNFSLIEFGRFEKVRTYWEYLQLNVYYVYALEMFLDVIQKIVRKNPGIKKATLLNALDDKELCNHLSQRLGKKIDESLKVADIISCVEELTGPGAKTRLNSKINESQTFDNIRNAASLENQLAEVLLLLSLLYHRYWQTSANVKGYGSNIEFSDPLNIEKVFNDLKGPSSNLPIFDYLGNLADKIVNAHLAESARRFAGGIRKWIFTEENSELYFARKDLVEFYPRDNRWSSIRSLLTDLQFIQEKDSKIILTDKGREWLSKIE